MPCSAGRTLTVSLIGVHLQPAGIGIAVAVRASTSLELKSELRNEWVGGQDHQGHQVKPTVRLDFLLSTR